MTATAATWGRASSVALRAATPARPLYTRESLAFYLRHYAELADGHMPAPSDDDGLLPWRRRARRAAPFEHPIAIKADLDAALLLLESFDRRCVWTCAVIGYDYTFAATLFRCSRWTVSRGYWRGFEMLLRTLNGQNA